MADGYKVTFDSSAWDVAFAALDGPVKESLARRMVVEGGVLLRDAAKSNARMGANVDGAEPRGVIARAIKLTKMPEQTTEDLFTYRVYWDSKIAPHAHLIEFGHWQRYTVYKAQNGEWYTIKSAPLDKPKWIAARPFMRPTFDSYGNTAIRVMLNRGIKELPILLAEHTKP